MKLFKNKKKKRTLIAKFRVAALFKGRKPSDGSYVLKSGLVPVPVICPDDPGYILDFSEEVLWSKDMRDSKYYTMEAFSIEALNAKINAMVLNIMRTYDRCLNEDMHPFCVITDTRYDDEKMHKLNMKIHISDKDSYDPKSALYDVLKEYLASIKPINDSNENYYHVEIYATRDTLNFIIAEFLKATIQSGANLKILKNSSKEFSIKV